MKRRLHNVKKIIMMSCAIVIISSLSVSTCFAWAPWYYPDYGHHPSVIIWGYDDDGPWCP